KTPAENFLSTYYLTNNPASVLYEKNIEKFTLLGDFNQFGYKRTYDPESERNIVASFSTLRKISDRSFFAAGISYDDLRLIDMYGSREKDFYDDYFSTIDSSGGSTAYYGPRLTLLYNLEVAKDLYFGVMGSYGVERGLKDTFPETITIMRNSIYQAGMDYRKPGFSIGVHGRYYDDQTYYESVKSYSEVKAKTYIGYNVFYNENSSSTSKKKRNRSGFEYGGHLRLGGNRSAALNVSISGLKRASRTEMYTSYSKPRGLWQRKGLHLQSDLTMHFGNTINSKIYGEYLNYNDWGESLISNALVLENNENYAHAGGIIVYRPSMLQKAFVGAEIGKVAYDYIEYVFPFSDSRSGTEWTLYGGADFFLSSKTKLNFNLEYGKEVPKFYWNTDYFQNTALTISLEQLFSFGYIVIMFENIKKIPANDSQSISLIQFGLSYRTK
ncbi:MAG: hypothetical protein K9N05_08725, partial [Candidatus Marinimicrobia bacterium]|nr:hypothetical protein [Candidatus Neomarinimicrobiota bacterium]